MIPAPPIGLTQTIERVQIANEQKLAAEIGVLKTDISTEAALQLKHFGAWCRSRGVKSLPCAPASVAGFIRSEVGIGVPPDRVVDAVWAIEALHDNAGYSNPCATASVRIELGRILNLGDGPRSWPRADRVKYLSLPIEIRAVIERRATADTKVLRGLQNSVALLRQLKQQKEGTTNGENQ